ncbi:MAG: pyridoxal 5'-phosphate synthase lyase subunit PdxS, partial [[Ruminococcus] lactaris]|nr:pyridoxal 5'-phosphate synthase lyase subunit PdxS [[Ruminococcus] lactaris]
DDIIGFLHLREAMTCYLKEEKLRKVSVKELGDYIRPVVFIPETKGIDRLFKEMQMKKNHIAIVVDEYGQTSGLVTMEDIVEEIMGNILDEHDEEEELIHAQPDGSYLVDGMTILEDLSDLLNISFQCEEDEEYDTLNGFLIGELERIPADIRAAGGVSRMSDPKMIKGIQEAVSIPVMAKCRIGHFAEAQVLQAIEIDYIDESEVLSPADDVYHINKRDFDVPFVCGAKDLGEALRRINEGASMIRTKGEPGTGDIVQAVRHMRMMNSEIARIKGMREDELFEAAKQLQVPFDLVLYVHENGKLPVVNFAAGGVATPADAALMMQLGAEGVFVGSGIFKSGNPAKRAAAIVQAVTNYTDAKLIAELSADLGEAMVGINEQEIALLMAERGK